MPKYFVSGVATRERPGALARIHDVPAPCFGLIEAICAIQDGVQIDEAYSHNDPTIVIVAERNVCLGEGCAEEAHATEDCGK
jgi:hypothetical protein